MNTQTSSFSYLEPSDIRLSKVRLRHHSAALADIPGAVTKALSPLCDKLRPGMRIAITAGSRGIRNMDIIVRTVAEYVSSRGASPFVIPAMGSHGGATAQGQKELLAGYGITEASVSAPIISSMEVVQIGTTPGEPHIPVFMDKNAWESDGVIVVNRVKPHTDFHGTHESGVVKMMTIGLGKHRQALEMHRHGSAGLRDYIPEVSRVVAASGRILGALGIVEDGYDNTSIVRFAQGMEIFDMDRELLVTARENIPRLPFDDLDLLIVDEIGKNYSGTNLDTNVIGRIAVADETDGKPFCRVIVALDLSEKSHGNALGVGLADVVTERLRSRIDWKATYENVITSGFLKRGFLPVVQETDRDAVRTGIRGLGRAATAHDIRLARIRNTLRLDEIWISDALKAEFSAEDYVGENTTDIPLSFDENGIIMPF
ncbi:MAG: DUF2088 domain-containing protein [Lachnospiraceae bacterium]|nr:DUF2088 domain-containing protein [Lachnospiraceae bacterium]